MLFLGIELGLEKLKLTWEKDLQDFKSSIEGIRTLADRRMENLRLSGIDESDLAARGRYGNLDHLATDKRPSTLESIRRAPTRGDVIKWMRDRGKLGIVFYSTFG